jgi:CheY-like chemotaxis protein
VSIEVLDTGIGIASSDQGTIFKEFQRLESGARVAPGLGLGLSIVERLADVLGVTVRLDSTVGRGTRVSIEVPAAAASPATITIVRTPAGAPATGGMVVLCLDNDEKILAGMDALLSGWDCRPVLARTAREAMQRLKESGSVPDVMLVDYHLDEGDGLAAVAHIRWKLGEDIPAILITADRSPELRERALKAGIRVLNKPLKPAALRALMAHWRVRRPAAE